MKLTKAQKNKIIKTQSVASVINADVVYDTKEKTREEIFGSNSIRNNKDKITGSQLGVVMGLSHFKTPLSLWKEKIGLESIEVDEEKEIFKAGHAAEEFVAQMFARRMKEDYGDVLESVDIIHDTNMYQSRKYPWAIGEPDRFAILTFKNKKIELVGLECKTVFNQPAIEGWKKLSFPCPSFYDDFGETSIPPTYDAQNRHYMMVTDLTSWYTCCCWHFTNSCCSYALIKRDDNKERIIEQSALSFIECCTTGMEPVMCQENKEAIAEYLNQKYDLANADRIEADDTYLPLITEATELADEKAALKRKMADLEEKEMDLAKRIVEKSEGKGSYISYLTDENSIGITLGISHFKDSINIQKIQEEHPEIYEKMASIGIGKVSKTDLEKIEVDGKKFNATPYIIEGGVNKAKPVTISKVSVKPRLIA